ncbi:MAG: DUF4349 domain-containing protein [Acidobacteria bacterium]|nr:DUF4349 domain-containing protein [Acidobacteriota bacterium]
MKIIPSFALFLFALSISCGSGEQAATNANAYKSSGTSQPSTAAPAQSDQPATRTGSGSGNGGGGGGGRETQIAAVAGAPDATLAQSQTSQIDTAPTDRKIVRNADLNLEAESPEESQKSITSIAESKGGFVVESQQSISEKQGTTRDTVTMTVRVPAAKFAEAVDEIRKTASRVIVETIKGDDVTEEFIDVEARLKAKKALEQQFMEIMKRANSVEDALNVQRQLGEVRSEIEKIEGRKRFLENQSSLSTIKVRIQTKAAFAANSSGFFTRLTESFSTGLDFALSFILGMVTLVVSLLPFLLFIGLPGFFLIRYLIRKLNRSNTVTVIENSTEEKPN